MFSVVIPSYNHAAYAANSVKSARAAGAAQVILVNDGSSDETLSVLEEFSQEPWFTLINQQNSGAAAARNNGFLAVREKLVFFLDADDELFPDALSILEEGFDTVPENVGLASGWLHLVDPQGSLLHKITHPVWAIEQAPHWFLPNSGNFALRTSWGERMVAKSGHLYNPHFRGLSENAAVWVRLHALGCRALLVPHFCVKYRQQAYGLNRSSQLSSIDPREQAWNEYRNAGYSASFAMAISLLTKLKRWHPQFGVSDDYLSNFFKQPWFANYIDAVCLYSESLSLEQSAYWGGLLAFFFMLKDKQVSATIEALQTFVPERPGSVHI